MGILADIFRAGGEAVPTTPMADDSCPDFLLPGQPANKLGGDQDAAPCPTCGSAIYWDDPYGERHCIGCEPPVSDSQVRARWIVATTPTGDHELERLGGGGDTEQSAADSCFRWTAPDGCVVCSLPGRRRYWEFRPGMTWDEWWDRRGIDPAGFDWNLFAREKRT